MRTKITSEFNASADEVWGRVKRTSTFIYISSGLLSFANAESFPEEWETDKTLAADIRFFGFIPGGTHYIQFKAIDDVAMRLNTEEWSGMISSWNHVITVEPLDGGRCRYTDDVEMHAGIMTPLVWLFSQLLYRYRQRRWHSLLRAAQTLKRAAGRKR